ncbi:MAG: CHAD domain-containing protein [Rhodomicrobium sp.]|jgi:inorganic triphosphatase YgiF
MLAPTTATQRELELKLELPAEDLKRLRGSALLRAASGGKVRKVLTSVYFDTADWRLQREGIALRVRNGGGGSWVQTVKSDATLEGGLSSVRETEARIEGSEPDLERIGDKNLRQRIENVLEKEALTPLFETIVARTAYRLNKGECAAELAIDIGKVAAGEKTKPIREVELELLSGSVDDFLAMAKELFSGLGARPSASNKAERGYRLLQGEPERAEPSRGQPVALKPNDSAREAFATILGAAGRQIALNQRAIVQSGGVESVHQMRVGLTRLRSALRSLEPYASGAWIGELEGDAQNLARRVGSLRDADVLIEDIYAPVAGDAAHVAGLPELLEALKAQRKAAYKDVRQSLGKGEWTRVLLGMALGPHLLAPGSRLDEPIDVVAGEILERRWKKVRKYGERLEELDLEQRHSMRKAIKKLRYNAEFFQSLHDKKAQRFIKRVKKMQELFGAINDVRMAHGLIGIAEESGGGASLAAAGYILGRNEARAAAAWTHAKREWEQLKDAAGFWR